MNQNPKKVKSILFEYELAGQGIVNYDGKEQKWILKNLGFKDHVNHNDNNNYCKKTFYRGPDGKIEYKVKISGNCIKKEMFGDDMVSENNSITHNKSLNMVMLSSPIKIVRGYMQTEKDEMGLKRKSCININDAIQSNNSISTMELFTKSGEKKKNKVETEVDGSGDTSSDPTLYRKETIGEIEYKGTGSINIKQLEFVSTDDIFDRLALSEDDFQEYKKYAKLHIPNFDSEIGYYVMVGSMDLTPERGFVFNNENKNFLVKYILERLLGIRIQRANAYAHIKSLKIKLVYDPIEDTHFNEENWIEISSREQIDNLYFNFHEFYKREEDEANCQKLRQEMQKQKDEYQNNKKGKKAKEPKAKTTEN